MTQIKGLALAALVLIAIACINLPAFAQRHKKATAERGVDLFSGEDEGLRLLAAETYANSPAIKDDFASRRLDLFRALMFYMDGIIQSRFPKFRGEPTDEELRISRALVGISSESEPEPARHIPIDSSQLALLARLRWEFAIYAALGGEYDVALSASEWVSQMLRTSTDKWKGQPLKDLSRTLNANVSIVCGMRAHWANGDPTASQNRNYLGNSPETRMAALENYLKNLKIDPTQALQILNDSSQSHLYPLCEGLLKTTDPYVFNKSRSFGYPAFVELDAKHREINKYLIQVLAGTYSEDSVRFRGRARLASIGLVPSVIAGRRFVLFGVNGTEAEAKSVAKHIAAIDSRSMRYEAPDAVLPTWSIFVNLHGSADNDANGALASAFVGQIPSTGVLYDPVMQAIVVVDPWFGAGGELTRANAMNILVDHNLRHGFSIIGFDPTQADRTADLIVPPIALALEHGGLKAMEDDYRLYQLKEALARGVMPKIRDCLSIKNPCPTELCEAVKRYFAIFLSSRKIRRNYSVLEHVIKRLRGNSFDLWDVAMGTDEGFREFIAERSTQNIDVVWRKWKVSAPQNLIPCTQSTRR